MNELFQSLWLPILLLTDANIFVLAPCLDRDFGATWIKQ